MLEPAMPKKPKYPQHELAERLRTAMEDAELSLADLSRACGVTIQAVHDWRETGRIGKHHLVTISQATRKPLEYFLVGLGRAAAVMLVLAGTIGPSAQADASMLLQRVEKSAYYVKWKAACRRWLWLLGLPGFGDNELVAN